MAISTTSYTQTPQAQDDSYTWEEDALLASGAYQNYWEDTDSAGTCRNVLILDVMANDLGGKAKQLYSIDDGGSGALTDLLERNVNLAWENFGDYSVRINSGKIEIDISGLIAKAGGDPAAGIGSLNEGQAIDTSFQYAIRLGNGTLSLASVSLHIDGSRDGPQAVADTAAGTENQILTVDVLANDIGTDVGQNFSLVSASAPDKQGSVAIVDGQLVFDPGSDFDYLATGEHTTVTLNYTVADDQGNLSSSTVTITVTGTNDVPVITSMLQAALLSEGGSGDPLATATNTDGVFEGDGGTNQVASGQITFTDADLSDTHTFSISSAAAYGTATVDATGRWNYTVADSGDVDRLAAGETLADSFSVQVDDGHGGLATQVVNVTITGTNDVPVAQEDWAAGGENQTLTIDVLANDTDVDNGHSFTLVNASAPENKGSATIEDGKLIFSPGGDFDHLAAGVPETVILNYTMQDEQGALSSSTVMVTITGTNDAPSGTASAMLAEGTEDTAYTVAAADLLAGFSDVDGDPLAVARLTADHGTVAASADGTQFTITPDADYNGPMVLSYDVTDGELTVAGSQIFSLAAVNDPAIIGGTTTSSLAETDAVLTAGGSLSIVDIDSPQTFLEQHDVAGSNGYGRFSIDASGNWTYATDTAHNEFVGGVTYTDSFSVATFDGTTQVLAVSIQGTNDAATDIALAMASSPGNTNLPGNTLLGQLSVSDPDGGGAHSYSLLSLNVTKLDGSALASPDTSPDLSVSSTGAVSTGNGNNALASGRVYELDVQVAQDGATQHEVFSIITGTNSGDSIDGASTNGDDVIYGVGNSADTIFAGSGNDTVFGQAGNDEIHGGTGNDILWGNSGADVFKWSLADIGTAPAADVVKDFAAGDMLNLADLLDTSNLGNLFVTQDSSGTTIHLASGTAEVQSIFLEGYTSANDSAAHILNTLKATETYTG